MTLDQGTTVGFSAKGLNSHCCLPAPPAAAFLPCTAWGCTLEQPPGKRLNLPVGDHISDSHESPFPTPAPEAVAGTGTVP